MVSPDLAAQTEQAFRNVLAVLAEAGAARADVIKLTIYLRAKRIEQMLDELREGGIYMGMSHPPSKW